MVIGNFSRLQITNSNSDPMWKHIIQTNGQFKQVINPYNDISGFTFDGKTFD